MYGERQKSRDRSRDREKRHNRSPSQQQEYRSRRQREGQYNRSRSKRVKFDENADVRVFRKEDEPTAKGLSEEQVNRLKSELEKEVARINDFGWEQARHRELLNERHSRKEQKDKEKLLMERLGAVNQSMGYSCPVSILGLSPIIELGCDSEERLGHTHRCYYTSLGQIPDDPLQELLNNNSPSECKTIKFDNDNFSNNLSYAAKKPPEKPLKGILKMPLTPAPEQRAIDPQLILLLKDLKTNPSLYSKQKTQQLLKPYKDSGQLEYLTKNKEVLELMLRNIGGNPPNRASISVSAGRQSHDRSSQPQNYQPMQYGHTFVPKADKFRTVPCKYYHSHLGCNKIDNCTYIHDQRYAGVAVPPNYTPPSKTPTSKGPGSYPPQEMYNNNSTPNPGYANRPPPSAPGTGYVPPPYPAYGNSGYYGSNGPSTGGYPAAGGPSSSHFTGSNSGNYPGSNNNYGNSANYGSNNQNYSANRPNYPANTPGGNYGANSRGFSGSPPRNPGNAGNSGGYDRNPPPPPPSYPGGNPPSGYQNYYMNYGGYYGQNGGNSSGNTKPN